jgi:hypothetical protein
LLALESRWPLDPWIYYARALHWATNTITTVGFGDIVPTKLQELIFYVCTSIVATVAACTSIGLLIPALKGSNMLKETWLARVERADAFIKRHKIPPELARRIQEYLQYQWLFLRGADESTFFAGLPASLRSEVRFALNHKLLRSIPSFASLDADTIAALAGLLYPVIYTTDEHLLKCSSVADDGTLTIVPQTCSTAWLLVRGMVLEFGMMEECEDASVRENSSGAAGSPLAEGSQKRSVLSENSLSARWRKRAANRLRQIRTYDEGDCILPPLRRERWKRAPTSERRPSWRYMPCTATTWCSCLRRAKQQLLRHNRPSSRPTRSTQNPLSLPSHLKLLLRRTRPSPRPSCWTQRRPGRVGLSQRPGSFGGLWVPAAMWVT